MSNEEEARLVEVVTEFKSIITDQSNVITDLQYKLYKTENLANNYYGQLQIAEDLREASEKLAKAERLTISVRVAGVSVSVTLAGVLVVREIFK